MLTVPGELLGRDIDLGSVDVTADRVRQYALAVDDDVLHRGRLDVAPLGFVLALRGGPLPAVPLAADTVSVHGGHTITSYRALTTPGVYRIQARVVDVFEKSGRSGPLSVIARRAEIRAGDGSLVATVEDQQIVRWRDAKPAVPVSTSRARREDARYGKADEVLGAAAIEPAAVDPELEVGGLAAFQRRLAPSASAIATYAGSLAGGEPMFTDPGFARALGYADVIVPGPLQSAFIETFLRERLPRWTLRRLSLSFRVSLIAREPISLAAVVVEHASQRSGAVLVCDLSLENRDGERAALGLAELTRES